MSWRFRPTWSRHFYLSEYLSSCSHAIICQGRWELHLLLLRGFISRLEQTKCPLTFHSAFCCSLFTIVFHPRRHFRFLIRTQTERKPPLTENVFRFLLRNLYPCETLERQLQRQRDKGGTQHVYGCDGVIERVCVCVWAHRWTGLFSSIWHFAYCENCYRRCPKRDRWSKNNWKS